MVLFISDFPVSDERNSRCTVVLLPAKSTMFTYRVSIEVGFASALCSQVPRLARPAVLCVLTFYFKTQAIITSFTVESRSPDAALERSHQIPHLPRTESPHWESAFSSITGSANWSMSGYMRCAFQAQRPPSSVVHA